jgi:hypothetical protein
VNRPVVVSPVFAGKSGTAYVMLDNAGLEKGAEVWRLASDDTVAKVLTTTGDPYTVVGSPETEFCVYFEASSEGNGEVSAIGLFGTNSVPLGDLPKGTRPTSQWDESGTKLKLWAPRNGVVSTRTAFLDAISHSYGESTTWKIYSQRGMPCSLQPNDNLYYVTDMVKDLQPSRCLITRMRVGASSVSANGQSIAFESEGSVFACSVEPISADMYEKIRLEAVKREAIEAAKQNALALLMFAADNDDKVGSASELQDRLGPYLKNQGLQGQFSWTYEGSLDFTKVESPAEFVLGFVQTPFGQAVAYADGHVKWQKNP